MNIIEFRNKVALVYRFVNKMDEENVPDNIKRIMVKFYANTLRMHLTDKMTDDIIKNPYAFSGNTNQKQYALGCSN